MNRYILSGVIGAMLIAYCWWFWNWNNSRNYKAGYDFAVAEVQSEAAEALAGVIAENARRYEALEKAVETNQKHADAAQADADSFRAANVRLHSRINKMVADAKRDNPALAEGGPTAGTSLDMLAYMFRRISEAAGRIGEHADSARNAGLTCEAVYDGVRGSDGR